VMGLSRDTFYRYQSAIESGGLRLWLTPTGASLMPKNQV